MQLSNTDPTIAKYLHDVSITLPFPFFLIILVKEQKERPPEQFNIRDCSEDILEKEQYNKLTLIES